MVARVLTLTVLVALGGCVGRRGGAGASEADGHASASKGRARMWRENCNTCHNARSSRYYSDEQWDVAMHHMRVRGYLTAQETKAILEFLRSAN